MWNTTLFKIQFYLQSVTVTTGLKSNPLSGVRNYHSALGVIPRLYAFSYDVSYTITELLIMHMTQGGFYNFKALIHFFLHITKMGILRLMNIIVSTKNTE